MGGYVGCTANNNYDFVTNLCKAKLINTPQVEQLFRMVDRGDFVAIAEDDDEEKSDSANLRRLAYRDCVWRSGSYHLSAPCIYSRVVAGLDLKQGVSFLNIGSGIGYISTIAGLVLGARGVNHGIEINPDNVKFANDRLEWFIQNSEWYDPMTFCHPLYKLGNGLLTDPQLGTYDRVYCGAGVPEGYQTVFKCLLNLNGIVVMPYGSELLKVTRIGQSEWEEEVILNSVSFMPLVNPTDDDIKKSSPIKFALSKALMSDLYGGDRLTSQSRDSDDRIWSLQFLSRLAVLENIKPERRSEIKSLLLPKYLLSYLTYGGELKDKPQPEKPRSLIEDGTLPEDDISDENADSMNLEDIVEGSIDITRFFMIGRNRANAGDNNNNNNNNLQTHSDSDHDASDNDDDNYYIVDNSNNNTSNSDDVIMNNDSTDVVVVQNNETNNTNNPENSSEIKHPISEKIV